MLSQLFLKTKNEISNIQHIDFSAEQWQWYYEEGVEKRFQHLSKKEKVILEIYIRARRAKNLTKDHKKLFCS